MGKPEGETLLRRLRHSGLLILKWMLKKNRIGLCGLDSSWSWYREVAGCFERRVLWFQQMQGTSWAAEDVLVFQERLIHTVHYSIIWCCVWGWIKGMYKSYYLRCQTCRNFNCCWYVWRRALVFMLMWYEAYAQKEHGCGSPSPWSTLENWFHFEVWGVTCLLGTKSIHGCCLLTACGSAWQWCDVRQHVAKWCHM